MVKWVQPEHLQHKKKRTKIVIQLRRYKSNSGPSGPREGHHAGQDGIEEQQPNEQAPRLRKCLYQFHRSTSYTSYMLSEGSVTFFLQKESIHIPSSMFIHILGGKFQGFHLV